MLGSLIARARKERGVSQGVLGSLVGGFAAATVSRWESELALPQMETMPKLIRVLDLQPEELLVALGWYEPERLANRPLAQHSSPNDMMLSLDRLERQIAELRNRVVRRDTQ